MSYKNISKENIEELGATIRDQIFNQGFNNILIDFLDLSELPDLSDLHIRRNIWVDNNHLKNLIGSPKSVGGCFFCYNNPLESLEGLPEHIGDKFVIDKETWDKLPKDTNEVMYLLLNNKLQFDNVKYNQSI